MNSQRKSSKRSSGGKGKLRPTGVLNGGSRPAPHALWSGFTKESLPIGTEIEVDGYLEPQRPRDRPRCHVSGWKKVVSGIVRSRCCGPEKLSLGAS